MVIPSAERIAAVRAAADVMAARVVELAAKVAGVASPTGEELTRGRYVADLLRAAGVDVLDQDEMGNVVARVKGRGAGPPLLLAAHLDTVFPATIPLSVKCENGRLSGPGVGDNSLGLAALITLPDLLRQAEETPSVDLLLAADAGEEGLGNLRGMRAVMDAHPEVGAVVAVEGHNLGRVTHIAVGSKRLRVTVRGPGGHSWGDYGRPSAIHVLARLIDQLASLPLPSSPKTTLNVGVIEGGISVNSIAPSASFLLDIRSMDAAALRRTSERVDRVITGSRWGGVKISSEVLGERPAGVVPLDSRIIGVATEALAAVGIDAICDASSTDANIPISRGVPAICIGLARGGNVHRSDEYIEIAQVAKGLTQLALISLQLASDLERGLVGRDPAR